MAVTRAHKVIKFAAAADAITGREKVSKIRWENAAANDDVVEVQDTAGNHIASFISTGTGEDYEVSFKEGIWVNGITVASLSSGTIVVYIL